MSLTAEHLADLQTSGLTVDTIAICGFEAVRPQDIKLRGATSAYRIPYFTLDGSKNCFERWKLFPTLSTPTGKQKYHQATGTAPALYMPPLFSWKKVAQDSRTPVLLVEGEKKAASACQRGLFAAGVAGVWNWRQRLETGEPLVLPTLDQFTWKDRTVELVPDSDAWREDKLLNVLGGFYALGQELISRGATVRLVRLPERSGVKVGLDDWLVATGEQWETDWPALERVSLDDPRLVTVASWWQRWREKQATQASLASQDLDELTLDETAGVYSVTSRKHAVRMVFERLVDQRGGITAEASVYLGASELLSGVDLNLKSDTGQKKLSDSLKVSASDLPWKVLLQRACALVKQRHRRGDPVTLLTRHTVVEPLAFLVNPFVYQRKVSILYGDGGKGKSTFALFLAMLVSTGQTVAGIRALRGRALYLDYEDDDDIHALRLKAVIAGHPELAEAAVAHQRCAQPLSVLAPQLHHRIQQDGLSFLIIDSLFAASGGVDAEQCARFFAALRPLKIATLVLGHVPKPQEGVEPSIYGSVFNKNYARATWELRAEQEGPGSPKQIGLYNAKINYGAHHPPLGFSVFQTLDHSVFRYEPCDLTQTTELVKGLPAAAQIRNLLERDGTPRTAKEISEDTGLPLSTVKSTLSRDQGRKWQKLAGDDYRTQRWTVLGGGK